jgi:hypothetical protein
MMMKYKVGDKVKVVAMKCGHQFDIGEVITIHKVNDYDYCASNGKEMWYMQDSEIEPYTPPPQIEVGGKYTSRNGDSWDCIFVRDGVAWLNHGTTTAYTFKIDGTPICLGAGSKYTIDLGPKVEECKAEMYLLGNVVNVTFTTLDGVPDWTTAKISPA